MKIGIVLSSTPGYSETFFRSKIQGLQDNGIDVHLFCFTAKEDFNLCPVTVIRKISDNTILQSWYFIKEFILLLPYLPTVIKYVKLERNEGEKWGAIFKKVYLNTNLLKAKVDWLHFGFGTIGLGRETVSRAIGAKMAVSFRGFDITIYPVKHPNCYALLWRYVDKIHVISGDILTKVKKNGLPDTIPTVKITPALDLKVFRSVLEQNEEIKKIIFMTTARLHWKKGFIQTLEALAILDSEGYDFEYRIIGKGEEYERIAFTAFQLGLKDRVQFLGKLTQLQVKEELENAHIYLQYSIQEGFCNAVLEAQAMGKLCIVSNAEGLSENVLHDETGWVVPKHSPQLLAEQIRKVLLMEQQEKTKVSKNARERVRGEFNIHKQKEEFLNFYRS
jgi:colanic acid/amylovoran biosynthesis glycosyltransferase